MNYKTYTDFPEAYFKLLRLLNTEKKPIVLKMTFRNATTQRRAIYRFREKLFNASSFDKEAAELYKLAKDIHIQVSPADAPPGAQVSFIVSYDTAKAKVDELFGSLDR